MVRGADLLGDGVNVAARLQALAAAGGVCLSGEAHQYARKALSFAYEDLGHQTVRNMEEPISLWREVSWPSPPCIPRAWPREAVRSRKAVNSGVAICEHERRP